MNVVNSIICAFGVLVLAGCAAKPVTPTYVSSSVYKDYSCAQLAAEYSRVNQYIVSESKGKPVFDTTGVGVGISAGRGGVYPHVSVGMGRSSEVDNSRLSRTLGERDAIAEAARFKGCDFPITHKTQPAASQ